jgi:hypothetical protein
LFLTTAGSFTGAPEQAFDRASGHCRDDPATCQHELPKDQVSVQGEQA